MFNPEARWDRPLPADAVEAGEAIEVEASFKPGKFLPVWFILSGQKHNVKKVNFFWQKKNGRETFCFFSVTDEQDALYKLCFSRQTLVWRLIDGEE